MIRFRVTDLLMQRSLLTLSLCAACFLVALAAPAQATHWVGSWAASQQAPEPANVLPAENLRDFTLREVVHLSIAGPTLRLHLSNAFGTQALSVTSVHIARLAAHTASPVAHADSTIDPQSDHTVLFAGLPAVTIPPGAEYVSDPIAFPLEAQADLAVSLHLDAVPAAQTGHPGSRATSFYAPGDLTSAASISGRTIEHWYWLSGVDVESSRPAVICLGDSITDGHGATTNGNDRWTDVLAAQLKTRGVLNQGIGGNHMLTDGLGPNVLARFDRDVLAQAGADTLVLFEGINDLGALSLRGDLPQAEHDAFVARLEAAFQQVVTRAHTHGLRVVGGTLTPWVGGGYYHPAAANEADRLKLNAWILAPGHFDDVIDFDKVVRDPAQPERMLPAFDSGDHLHPSPAGYKAMGEAAAAVLSHRSQPSKVNSQHGHRS